MPVLRKQMMLGNQPAGQQSIFHQRQDDQAKASDPANSGGSCGLVLVAFALFAGGSSINWMAVAPVIGPNALI
jgi:hypothetical protein